jgi:acetyl esterase/lipase
VPERLAYGDDPSQFGELSVPDGPARGVVVVLHGGFWKAAYDLSLGRPLAADLVSRGWVAWNLEYRRVGNGGGTPATFDDVAAGIDRLATVPGLDLSTVVTLGHSAGGHLATWAAARTRPAVRVTGVVAQAGVLDLARAHELGLGSGAVAGLLGRAPEPGDAAYDPVRQPPLDVPVRCLHGTSDDVVPIEISERYVAAATAAGGDATLVPVAGDHFVLIEPTSAAWARTVVLLDELGGRAPQPA